jgi:uncharacterized membrane protein YfcA
MQAAPVASRTSSRLLITGVLAVFTAAASVWLMRSSTAIDCNALAPLTVFATLSAFLISVCFRLMGRFPDRRSRWFLAVCLLIAAGTLFLDFRYVRRYRGFCGDLRQHMHQTSPR